MVEPAEPTAQAFGAGLAPVIPEVHAMAKVRVEQVAEREVALQCLNQIELSAATKAVEQVAEGGHEMINDEEQRQGAFGRRHAHKLYLFRTRIFELDGKNGKIMLRSKRTKHGQMATPDRIVVRYLEIEYGDAQAKFPLQLLSVGGG